MKLSSCVFTPAWTTDSMESIWAYLLENGSVSPESKTKNCLLAVRDIGINWDQVRMPCIRDRLNEENGDTEVVLEGTLVLNDWTWYNWYYIIDPPNTKLNSITSIDVILEYRLKEFQ